MAGIEQPKPKVKPAAQPRQTAMVPPPPPAVMGGGVGAISMYPPAMNAPQGAPPAVPGMVPDQIQMQPEGYDYSPGVSYSDNGGVPMPTLQSQAAEADKVFGQNADYNTARDIYKKLRDSDGLNTNSIRKAAEGLAKNTTGTLQMQGHGLLGLIGMAQNYRATKQANQLAQLKFLKELNDSGDKDAMDMAAKHLELGKHRDDLIGDAGLNQRAMLTNDQRSQTTEERARHNQAVEMIRQFAEQNKMNMTEAQIQHLAAQTQTINAGLPYVAPKAQAQINLMNSGTNMNNVHSQVMPINAAAGVANATGRELTPEMYAAAGVQGDAVSPAAATAQPVPQAATAQPVPQPVTNLNPKAAMNAQKTQQQIEASKQTQAKTANDNALIGAKLESKAKSRAEEQMLEKVPVNMNFWSSPEGDRMFNLLPKQTQQALVDKYKRERSVPHG